MPNGRGEQGCRDPRALVRGLARAGALRRQQRQYPLRQQFPGETTGHCLVGHQLQDTRKGQESGRNQGHSLLGSVQRLAKVLRDRLDRPPGQEDLGEFGVVAGSHGGLGLGPDGVA